MSGYLEYKEQMKSKKKRTKKDNTLKIKTKGKGKARKVAEKKLKESLKQEYSANITVNGDISYCAGAIVALDDSFGKFTGKYIINKVTHDIGDIYTCQLELLKVGALESAQERAKDQTKKEIEAKKKKSEKKKKIKKKKVIDRNVGYIEARRNM